jgi:hypothetical protein
VSQALRQAEKVSWLVTGIRGLLDAGRTGENCELLQLQVAVHLAVGDVLPLASSAGCGSATCRSSLPGLVRTSTASPGIVSSAGICGWVVPPGRGGQD